MKTLDLKTVEACQKATHELLQKFIEHANNVSEHENDFGSNSSLVLSVLDITLQSKLNELKLPIREEDTNEETT